MKTNFLFIITLFSGFFSFAQNVGINATGAVPNASAMLDVDATNKGILIPRVALTGTTDVTTVPGAANWLTVFNTANVSNVTTGLYYWNGTVWVKVGSGPVTDWQILGNAGTTAGTNFIGTTDAQAFVTKTGGSGAANERLRILATGMASYNNITPFAGDVFSVYGTGYAGAINALGNFALNGYTGAGGVGVYGESTSAAGNDGIGVYGSLNGLSTATTTSSLGVYGSNATTPAGTGIAIGVGGDAYATSGDARGVEGTTSSPAGIGTSGFNFGTTGNSFGIYGQSSSVAGVGIFGVNSATAYSTNTAVGVFGRSVGTVTTGNSIGVRGYADAATGNGYAFYGQSLSTAAVGGIAFVTSSGTGWQGQNAGTGDGVRGYNTSATPGTAGSGVYGQTNATTSFGGEFSNINASGTGVFGVGNNVAGTYLTAGSGGAFNGTSTGSFSKATTVVGGNGVVAVGNNIATVLTLARGSGVTGSGTQFGVVGFATTTVNTNPLNNAAANAANASAGGYFEVQNAGTAITWAYVGVREVAGAGGLRKIIGNGTVNTIVKDLDGELVALSCPEAPENLFQDYGQGILVNGKAHIDIDPILAKNIVVNDKHPLRVFIQLEGDCEGVYVTNKTQTGFDVIELKNGQSSIAFSYTIVANRADEVLSDGSISRYSEERFPTAPGPQEKNMLETKQNELPSENNIQKPLDDMDKQITPSPARKQLPKKQ